MPRKATSSPNSSSTAATPAASRLHDGHQGAQNHTTRSAPAKSPRSTVPPPTRGTVPVRAAALSKLSASPAEAALPLLSSSPHAPARRASTTAAGTSDLRTRRREFVAQRLGGSGRRRAGAAGKAEQTTEAPDARHEVTEDRTEVRRAVGTSEPEDLLVGPGRTDGVAHHPDCRPRHPASGA